MNFDLSREWLETNGIGGFACGTVAGANTRRYHALLCAATAPPLGRMVMVNKADETLVVNGERFALGTNLFPGAVEPRGYQYLERFTVAPLPQWTYVLPADLTGTESAITLEKTLWMPHGYNQTVIRYALSAAETAVELRVRPFVSGRDFHHLQQRNDQFDTRLHFQTNAAGGQEITLRPYESCSPIQFAHDGAFQADGHWYFNFLYEQETQRGLDDREDLYTPGEFVWRLQGGQSALLSLSTEPLHLPAQQKSSERLFLDGEIARRNGLTSAFANSESDTAPTVQRLVRAADQFLVRRQDDMRYTVLAGYPWFADWGRDTMIALPGLCLATGRIYAAASILLNFAAHVSQGMIPNRFPDSGETPDYNTCDATLWFFHATGEYLRKTGDWKTTRELYNTLRDCLHHHLEGTRYGIKADPEDGLLRGGEGNTQLTWMDAKVGDHAFTPRIGKPVEIQALWFNALRTLSSLARRANDLTTMRLCDEWSAKVRANFATQFWNEETGCLYDYIADDGRKDGAIRPNQIFAVSLPADSDLLSPEQERSVMEVVQRELLTPYGLRSLSPHDPAYQGVYYGNQWQRDGAYHQGTVWAWPIGGFLTAYLKVNNRSREAQQQALIWLQPLLAQLNEGCIGSINEIFDGDAPHTPRGCIAQAWSVSEVLRVLIEEL